MKIQKRNTKRATQIEHPGVRSNEEQQRKESYKQQEPPLEHQRAFVPLARITRKYSNRSIWSIYMCVCAQGELKESFFYIFIGGVLW